MQNNATLDIAAAHNALHSIELAADQLRKNPPASYTPQQVRLETYAMYLAVEQLEASLPMNRDNPSFLKKLQQHHHHGSPEVESSDLIHNGQAFYQAAMEFARQTGLQMQAI